MISFIIDDSTFEIVKKNMFCKERNNIYISSKSLLDINVKLGKIIFQNLTPDLNYIIIILKRINYMFKKDSYSLIK